jgi:sigma-E factor negative regulatory protein RseA
METKMNNNASISDAVDGELSDVQLDMLLAQMRQGQDRHLLKTWNEYHLIGDVLRSEDLDVTMSEDFSQKLMARLESEPILLAPKNANNSASLNGTSITGKSSRYMAMTSVAAAVMVAFVMAPQIISTINQTTQDSSIVAKVEANESFGSNIKLASNSSVPSSANVVNGQSTTIGGAKDMEFAPKLEDQVEMLRDPRLDSYLQAHQKVSPTFESGARHIQKANVVPTPAEK